MRDVRIAAVLSLLEAVILSGLWKGSLGPLVDDTGGGGGGGGGETLDGREVLLSWQWGGDRMTTALAVFLVAFVVQYGALKVYTFFLYHRFFSPLRHLPGPTVRPSSCRRPFLASASFFCILTFGRKRGFSLLLCVIAGWNIHQRHVMSRNG